MSGHLDGSIVLMDINLFILVSMNSLEIWIYSQNENLTIHLFAAVNRYRNEIKYCERK